VKAAFTHFTRIIDTKPDTGYGPFGSTSRTAGPKHFVLPAPCR
jgi:hypothetical protein